MTDNIEDVELTVIGRIISAVQHGRAGNIDAPAWQRIREYAVSLCRQGEREAEERVAETDDDIDAHVTNVVGRDGKKLTIGQLRP